MREIRFPATDLEEAAINRLAEEQCMSPISILRQALRLYELTQTRLRAGETCTWSGDAARVRAFVRELGDDL